MTRHHVNDGFGLVAVDGYREIRILMVPADRAQNDLGEPGPQVGVNIDLRLPGEALEIHSKPIREAASIQDPITRIQRTAEVQHDLLDFGTGPERLDHLRLRRVGCLHGYSVNTSQ